MTTQSESEMQSEQQIRPERITRPIQLLAAWLTGLVLVDGIFLSTAVIISNPTWIPLVLVISAIINVPIFLAAIFILQTRFRPEIQEDAYYAEYLKDKRNRVETMVKEIKSAVDVSMQLAEQRQQDAVQYFDQTLIKLNIDKDEEDRLRRTFRDALIANEDRATEGVSRRLLDSSEFFLISDGAKSILKLDGKVDLLGDFSTLRYEILVSRADALVKDLSPIDITASIHRICTLLRPKAEQGQKMLNVDISDEPIKALGTRGIVEIVLTEILTNAIAYTPNGSTIDLSFSRGSNDSINIAVSNPMTSTMLQETDKTKIFEPGYRGSQSTHLLPGGAGMGLHTVQKLVELINGSVEVGLDEGMFKVTVCLPSA